MKSARVQVCLEPELLDRVKQCATVLQVSYSHVIADVLRHNISQIEILCSDLQRSRERVFKNPR